MSEETETRYVVAIIGAGPAGLFAARELADRGIDAVLFNRDIKPGGLAEYGIYPSKLRMKEGLRNQFRQILARDHVDYYGNVLIGERADLSLDALRALGFQALLVTVGAQSTKHLGIPGEDFTGVYHAKDIVYHYNLLPPFSEATYSIGKRVAVIGVGNVMVDISRWLVEEKKVDQVIAIARRGPAEIKFDRKELESVINYLDMEALETELERVQPVLEAIGQSPADLRSLIQEVSKKGLPARSGSCFHLRFLSSPVRIFGDERGQVAGLEVEENMLSVGKDGERRAIGTGVFTRLDVDTIIFAIGDVVDDAIGLPVQYGEYVKNPQPRFPIEGTSYEAYDPRSERAIPDVFLAGWARRPSAGLVGVARKDAVNAVHAMIPYLEMLAPTCQPVAERVRARLQALSHPVVDKEALHRLEAIEQARARELNLEFFKYGSNQQILDVLDLDGM